MYPLSIQHILDSFSELLSLSVEDCESVGHTYAIPKFEENVLSELCQATISTLQLQQPLLILKSPVYVIGDIHGNIFDLIRIFNIAHPPPASRFLFLGDYVDRGQFSIEVLALLFSLQVAFPDHIYLLRGNHEFECVNSFYGFKDECLKQYATGNIYDEFNEVFNYMPLAAIINQSVFCVHGGLSPQLLSMDQINELTRPIKTYNLEFVADLVWSDPSDENEFYVRSNRGSGVTFGKSAVHEFLVNFNLNKIIRAHQCIQSGIGRFDGHNVYTVFSCSNYAEACQNRCGIIFINTENQIQAFSLPPFDHIDRSKTKINYVLPPTAIQKVKPKTKTFSMKIAEISKNYKEPVQNRYKPIGKSLSLSFIQVHTSTHKKILPPINSNSTTNLNLKI
ncbi:hypothetical protein M9Y10_002220 [Tritrichomonas musculus]|uniref:Serine/threonine-protein phosphatase n=1 Tax=Tritrichomonas musculus TaxID=1915356 RepID=A0ABR2LAV0_9EUKA